MENDPFAIVDEIPRKVMTLFYLVDTSGSMSGAKIGFGCTWHLSMMQES